MTLVAGDYQSLLVDRETSFGYFLTDGIEDVLLHRSETNNVKINIGDEIEAFLYSDHKGRIAATLDKPNLVLGEIGFLKVEDFKSRMGFFLDNNINKQVLLPVSELSEDRSIWPEKGDKVLVRFVHDKQERLLAEVVKDEVDIENYLESVESNNVSFETLNDKKLFHEGVVILHLSMGAQVYIKNLNEIGFLHHSEQLHELRLGETVQVRVSYIREDEKINLSMRPVKEISMVGDAEGILKILQDRGGSMPYWDKTDPDVIMQKFNLSKSAFKRALGRLMKEGVIYQEDGWTYLKER